MINWKALQKALLALLCYCYCFNSALAQETYQEPAMTQHTEPNTTQTAEPTPAYSKENPFANSQYTDLADLAELLIKQGYEVSEYFYSEGFTTGTDGVLGNEYICIRDDVNQVYIGRSDVCVDRAMDSTYTYVQIDKMDWTSGFPDQIVMQTGDLLGDRAQYWDGCYFLNQGWGGVSGGECPTINQNYPGADYSTQINFGYVQQTLTNLAAINIALEEAGVEATGYNYSWSVKNIDAGYKDSGNGERTPDTFYVEVVIRDTEGNAVFAKTYDYSRYIEQWTDVSGEETFKDPFDANTLESIQLNVTGKDLGYWAGYYGPEFANPSIKLNYRYTGNPAAEDTTVEDTLLTSQCIADPLYDPACPGYNNAVIAQIASTNTIDDINSGADIGVQTIANDGSTGTFDDTTGTIEQLADTTGAIIDDGSDTGSDNGMSDPVQETTGEPEPVQEAVAEVTPEPVQETTGEPEPVQEVNEQQTQTAVAEAEATSEATSTGTGLNATQLSAVNAASNVANSAVSASTQAAQTSANIGLSETGGVSSTLTSDGVTNEQGITSSMSNIIAGTGSTTSTTSFTSTQTANAEFNSSQSLGEPADGSVNVDVASTDRASGLEIGAQQDSSSNDREASGMQTQQLQQSIAGTDTTDTQGYTPSQADTVTDVAEEVPTAYQVPGTEQLFEVQQFDAVEIADTSNTIDTGVEQFAADESYVEQNDQAQMQAMMEITGIYITQNANTVDNFDMSNLTTQQEDNFGTNDMDMIPEPETVDLGAQELAGVQQDFTAIDQGTSNTTGAEIEQSTGEEFAVTEAAKTEDITGEEALAQATELSDRASLETITSTINSVPVTPELDFVGRFVADVIAALPALPPAQEAENKTADEERLEAFTEAVLIAKANNGDESEDAKAALLGYNPNFNTYITDQMKDAQFYKDKEIYTNKKNYDNPNSRLFNAGSDARYKALIDLQYDEEN